MSPTAVVITLDPEECVLPDVGETVPRPGVDEFFLVGREERFGDGVIVAGGAAAHGAAHAVDGAEVGEFFRGHCCVVRSGGLDPFSWSDQMARVSSVKAAITCGVVGSSTPIS